MYPYGWILLAVIIGFFLLKWFVGWADKEDRKNNQCPKCGKQLQTDRTDTTSKVSIIFYRSCSNDGCNFKDVYSAPIPDPSTMI